MPAPPPNQPEALGGLKLEDILFTLFRHKVKIILFFLMGLAAALYQYRQAPVDYESTAKLLVRYVVDSRGVEPIGSENNVRRPDSRGDTIINSEIEILTSWDLLESVARAVGPFRILGISETNSSGVSHAPAPGENALDPVLNQDDALPAATRQISHNLSAYAPNRGTVLVLTYRNGNPEMAQVVLTELVSRYLDKHHAIHRASGSYDFLLSQTHELQSRLNQTEDELVELKNKFRINDIDQAKAENNALLSRLTQSIRDAEAELAGYHARLNEVHRLSGSLPTALNTNLPPVDQAVLQRYKTLGDRLLRWREQEIALQRQGYAEASPLLRNVLDLIAQDEKQKLQLEADHPGLLTQMPAMTDERATQAPDPTPERMQIASIQARIAILKTQLESAESRATTIESIERQITQLERRRELERNNYIYFSESLERARVDATIDPKQIPNIIPVQEPSAPARVPREMLKKMAVIVCGAIAAGVALALLLDLVLDPSIKRPIEIESRLRIPLMLTIPLVPHKTIPRLLGDGSSRKRPRKRRRLLGDYRPFPPPPRPERAPWEISRFVRPFCDALRDRLILLFQLKELHHKPKLVALTSCSDGAGVTTLSAGLAASLSETGTGKVLLVDMNFNQTKAHPFLKGAFAPSLSHIIQPGGANGSICSDNLYLATGADSGDKQGALIPKQFYDLMPKLKASDFDYIIFDLPPMTQTSSTMALAPFMDQVILVVEADKDSREQVKRAHSALSSSRTNVVGVFNKNHARMPGWLQQDS